MENEQIADAILSVLQQLMEAAGPEWTLEALTALMEEAQSGGEQMQGPQMPMPSMPAPQPPGNAFASARK